MRVLMDRGCKYCYDNYSNNNSLKDLKVNITPIYQHILYPLFAHNALPTEYFAGMKSARLKE